MTTADLRARQARMGYTYDTAAAALACAVLAAGVVEWTKLEHTPPSG